MTTTTTLAAYLTISQVAEIAQRHYKTVALALRQGELHGIQQHGKNSHWRVRTECADAWIEGRPCEHKINVTAMRQSKKAS